MAKESVAKSGDNSTGVDIYEPKVLKRWMGEVDRLEREEREQKSSHAGTMSALAKRRKSVFARAQADGLPTKLFKGVIQQRKYENKILAIKGEFDDDEVESFEQMQKAVGDFGGLPLGASYLAKAKESIAKAGETPLPDAPVVKPANANARRKAKPTAEEAPTTADLAAKRKEVTEAEQSEFADVEAQQKADREARKAGTAAALDDLATMQ